MMGDTANITDKTDNVTDDCLYDGYRYYKRDSTVDVTDEITHMTDKLHRYRITTPLLR